MSLFHPAAVLDAERALEDLFRSLFTSSETLVRFLLRCTEGEGLVADLPSLRVPFADYVHKAVRELRARGLVDRHFWETLCDERPKRAGDIAAVRAKWPAEPRGPPSANSSGVGVNANEKLLLPRASRFRDLVRWLRRHFGLPQEQAPHDPFAARSHASSLSEIDPSDDG